MADSEFERFKKMFPGGTKDMNIQAIPAPIPGPGGIVRGVAGRGIQSGIRRFSDVSKADKTTKMKDRKGLERKDPMEPRVVPSGRSEALRKTREGGGGPTKMKDRRGLDIKPAARKAETPPSRGTPAKSRSFATAKGAAETKSSTSRPLTNAEVQRSSYSMTNPTQRPYDASKSPGQKPPIPKARPAAKSAEKRKPEKKSKVRIAFEKEFAAARRAGKKKFPSKLGKYGVYSTKLK